MRRSLAAVVKGQKIKDVLIRWPKIVSGRGNLRKASFWAVREFRRGILNRKIIGIERRGKNLIFILSAGRRIIVHLKMSGRFAYYRAVEIPKNWSRHDHIIFKLSRGTLVYNDTRKFGYLIYYPNERKAEGHFTGIGVEPLSSKFTAQYLEKAFARKNARIKTVLMDQSVVAGLGNIYCDESLFLSGINPTRKASSLKPEEIKKLHRAIRKVLSRAIKLGGSTVFTYRTMEGKLGRYADEHKVYGRAGEECLKCGSRLCGIKINNRATVYCSRCQN